MNRMHIMTMTALVVAMIFVAATPSALAEERATPIDDPVTGERYYIYAFPHGMELWQETNGVTSAACPGIANGIPLGHPLPPDGYSSGLQTTSGSCNGVPYAADTLISDWPL